MSRRSRKNLRIALVGAHGRMGRWIAKLAPREGLGVTHLISGPAGWPASGRDIDCVIEFSSPEGLRSALQWCLQHRKPLVAGATGLSASDKSALKKAAKKIPILYSANMSLGVAVIRAMVREFGVVGDWKFEMEEIHHIHKKDKPSGTAKLLKDQLVAVTKARVPVRSVRRGSVPGTHQILAQGPDETILLRHTAHHRRVFARGAIRAARWLFDKNKPGLYDLGDLYAV